MLLPVGVVKVNPKWVVDVVVGSQGFREDDYILGAVILHLIDVSMISFCLVEKEYLLRTGVWPGKDSFLVCAAIGSDRAEAVQEVLGPAEVLAGAHEQRHHRAGCSSPTDRWSSLFHVGSFHLQVGLWSNDFKPLGASCVLTVSSKGSTVVEGRSKWDSWSRAIHSGLEFQDNKKLSTSAPDLAEECEDVGQGSRVDDDPPSGEDEGKERQASSNRLSHKELGIQILKKITKEQTDLGDEIGVGGNDGKQRQRGEKLATETIPYKDKKKNRGKEDKFKDGGDKEDSLLFQLRDRPPAGLLQHSLDFNDAWSLLHKKLLRLFCWLQTGHISLALLP